MNVWLWRLLVIANAAAFTVAVVGPLIVIHPGYGAATPWIEIFGPDLLEPTPVSILGGVVTLFRGDSEVLAALLVLFSWLFPIGKLLTCEWAIQDLAAGRRPGLFLAGVHAFGFLSMTECLVPAVLAVVLKQLPGGTTLELGWGFWLFVASATMTVALVGLLLSKANALTAGSVQSNGSDVG